MINCWVCQSSVYLVYFSTMFVFHYLWNCELLAANVQYSFHSRRGVFFNFFAADNKGAGGASKQQADIVTKENQRWKRNSILLYHFGHILVENTPHIPPPPHQEYFFIQITGFLFKLLLYFVLKSQQKTKLSVRLNVCMCVCARLWVHSRVCVCVDCQVFVCLKLKLAGYYTFDRHYICQRQNRHTHPTTNYQSPS